MQNYQKLQLRQTELLDLALSPELEENITGFYVRVEPEKDNQTPSIALIEGRLYFLSIFDFILTFYHTNFNIFKCKGVRLGRSYPIPNEEEYPQYLVLTQPPAIKFTCKFTRISNEQITKVYNSII